MDVKSTCSTYFYINPPAVLSMRFLCTGWESLIYQFFALKASKQASNFDEGTSLQALCACLANSHILSPHFSCSMADELNWLVNRGRNELTWIRLIIIKATNPTDPKIFMLIIFDKLSNSLFCKSCRPMYSHLIWDLSFIFLTSEIQWLSSHNIHWKYWRIHSIHVRIRDRRTRTRVESCKREPFNVIYFNYYS